jgi:hypothetical protein
VLGRWIQIRHNRDELMRQVLVKKQVHCGA